MELSLRSPLIQLWSPIFPFFAEPEGYDLSAMFAPELRAQWVGAWDLLGLFFVSSLFSNFLGEEFLFRGMQYKDAIARWYKQPGGTGQRQRPALNELKDLLLDPNMPSKVRYLRTLYPDPLTGEDWVPIKGGATGGIIGVHSASEKEPIKKAKSNTPPAASIIS